MNRPLESALAQLVRAIVLDVVRELRADLATPAASEWVRAAKCDVPKTTALRLVRTGEVKGRRVGREAFIHRAELAAWIERQASKPAAATPRAAPTPITGASVLAANSIRPLRRVGGAR